MSVHPSDMKQHHRRDGTTTRQILASPIGALFVSIHPAFCKKLAESLGRNDLKFFRYEQFGISTYRGMSPERVIFDHYVTENLMPHERPYYLAFDARRVNK
jgi:hypothetical protein